jgi:hypothetical protein
MNFGLSRAVRVVLGGLLTSLVFASTASAACDPETTTQPFAGWGDDSPYVLVPGGDFEASAGWTLRRGAEIAGGSDPYALTGEHGHASLSLPEDSYAITPPVCLDVARPTFRFVARSSDGDEALLKAQALPESADPLSLGWMRGSYRWMPSTTFSTGIDDLLLDETVSVPVRFKLTSLEGDWQVDDVFVDPQKWG